MSLLLLLLRHSSFGIEGAVAERGWARHSRCRPVSAIDWSVMLLLSSKGSFGAGSWRGLRCTLECLRCNPPGSWWALLQKESGPGTYDEDLSSDFTIERSVLLLFSVNGSLR